MALNKPEPKGYTFFGPEPKFADVPYAEWKARMDRTKKLMRENNVDLLVIMKEENCRYFTGFTSIHFRPPSIQPLVALIPVDGNEILIVPDFFRGTAEGQCWIRDIRGQENPHQIKSEREHPREVAAVIREMGYGKANIALEKGWLGHMWIPRPLNDIQTLMSELPDANFVDGDKVIWGCRMIKSPLEIERMKYSLSVVREAHGVVVDEFVPGMTEREVGRIVMHVFVEKGDWSIGGHIACGREKEGMIDTAHHFDGVTINTGDYLWLDLCVNCNGYWADNARIFQVGHVPDRVKKGYDVMYRAFDAAVEVMKPGVRCKDVWAALAKVEKDAGIEPFEMCGHGLGMDIHEPPSLGIWDETILEPGMTLNVEPAALGGFRRMGGDGGFHVEDLVVITETGCYVIYGFSRDIISV